MDNEVGVYAFDVRVDIPRHNGHTDIARTIRARNSAAAALQMLEELAEGEDDPKTSFIMQVRPIKR